MGTCTMVFLPGSIVYLYVYCDEHPFTTHLLVTKDSSETYSQCLLLLLLHNPIVTYVHINKVSDVSKVLAFMKM